MRAMQPLGYTSPRLNLPLRLVMYKVGEETLILVKVGDLTWYEASRKD
jgi:hypothetical protein